MSGIQSYCKEIAFKNLGSKDFAPSLSDAFNVLLCQHTAIEILRFLSNNLGKFYSKVPVDCKDVMFTHIMEFIYGVVYEDVTKYDQSLSSLIHLLLHQIGFKLPTFEFNTISEHIASWYSNTADRKLYTLLINLIMTLDLVDNLEKIAKTPRDEFDACFIQQAVHGSNAKNDALRASFGAEIITILMAYFAGDINIPTETKIQQSIHEILVFVKHFQDLEISMKRKNWLISILCVTISVCVFLTLYYVVIF